MALLEVTNVKKIYSTRFGGNKVQALSNVTFSVEEGEYVAIMGESGSGKTTLLNILAALDRPTSGEVLLEGKSITHLTEKEISAFRRKNLGFVFQDFNLLDTFSLRDNIYLPLVLAGEDYQEMEQKIRPIAKALHIDQLLEKFPYEVSGMIYRMKQNAAGLASICILSTGVLLLLSMTVSLYFGMGDIMVNRYPFDTDAQISGISQEQSEQFQKVFAQAIEDYQVPAEKTVTETYLEIGCKQGKNGIMIGQAYSYSEDGNSVDLYTIRQSEYEKLTGEKTDLHDGEIFAWYPSERETDTLKIDDWDFAVKKWLEKAPLSAMTNLVSNMAAIVVTDSDFEYIDGLRTKMYEGLDAYEAGKDLTVHLGVDIRGSSEEKIRYGQAVYQALKDYCHSDGFSENTIVIGGVRQSEYETYYVDNGSILFIGIFLGALFLMGTAMIIYYKQISEGYEDQGRFQIMQKVGMSRREVKGAIRRQILLVFFIPLVMAMVHISMAFPLIRRLLLLFGMANTKLYVGCTAGTVLAFALVYGLIYSMTARSYYKIVEKA